MKEIIKNVTATTADRATFSYNEELTREQILGVLNKTTGKAVYTPLKYGSMIMSRPVHQEDGTWQHTLRFTNLPPIAVGDKLLIKFYVESDAATDIKDFFGIVKDGDTVKVVTENGGEEVVEPVGLMDEDDVYDHLEDIAVLLGGITAQQAASITAATRAIIHGGSGSGSGE